MMLMGRGEVTPAVPSEAQTRLHGSRQVKSQQQPKVGFSFLFSMGLSDCVNSPDGFGWEMSQEGFRLPG